MYRHDEAMSDSSYIFNVWRLNVESYDDDCSYIIQKS